MSDPTRTQISADVTSPTTQVEIRLGGAWIDVSSSVTSVSIDVQSSNGVSGLAFGSTVEPRATVAFTADQALLQLTDGTNILTDGTNTLITVQTNAIDYAWALTPIRIKHGFSTSAQLTRFSGVITERSRDSSGGTWGCQGWSAVIASTDIRSPLITNRPIATKTESGGNDDPTDPGYTGGIVNYTLWKCGGRPYEQAGSYPNAVFYYSCDTALIAPAFSWIASENAWEALQRLVRAAGGQLYQDSLGVIRYKNPVSLVSGTASVTFSDAVLTAAQRVSNSVVPYQDISERASIQESLSAVGCQFVTRRIAGVQVIYEDTEPRYLAAVGQANSAVTLNLDTQYPIASVSQVEIDAVVIRTATAPGTGVAVVLNSSSAQRVTVTISNIGITEPIQIEAIRVVGNPVEPGEEGSASYAQSVAGLASDRTLQIEDNPWVQSRRHAEQLCQMVWDFYSGTGAIRTLAGVPYDPDRNVGELVNLTCSLWNITAQPHIIVGIRPENGAWMSVDLTPVLALLPTVSETYVVGGTYTADQTLEVGY
jgi:hypothetical protein